MRTGTQHDAESLNLFYIKHKNWSQWTFSSTWGFGCDCNAIRFLQCMEIMKSIGNVSLSSIKPRTHCLFYFSNKSTRLAFTRLEYSIGSLEVAFFACEERYRSEQTVHRSVSGKMHLVIPPTHLFPLEHKQINGWRWIGLRLTPPVSNEESINTHGDCKCSTEGGGNRGE